MYPRLVGPSVVHKKSFGGARCCPISGLALLAVSADRRQVVIRVDPAVYELWRETAWLGRVSLNEWAVSVLSAAVDPGVSRSERVTRAVVRPVSPDGRLEFRKESRPKVTSERVSSRVVPEKKFQPDFKKA